MTVCVPVVGLVSHWMSLAVWIHKPKQHLFGIRKFGRTGQGWVHYTERTFPGAESVCSRLMFPPSAWGKGQIEYFSLRFLVVHSWAWSQLLCSGFSPLLKSIHALCHLLTSMQNQHILPSAPEWVPAMGHFPRGEKPLCTARQSSLSPSHGQPASSHLQAGLWCTQQIPWDLQCQLDSVWSKRVQSQSYTKCPWSGSVKIHCWVRRRERESCILYPLKSPSIKAQKPKIN